MYQVVLIETAREGDFSIQIGVFGILKILSVLPLFTGYASVENIKDFSVKIPIDEQYLKISYDDLDDKLRIIKKFTIDESSEKSITIMITVVTPYDKLKDEKLELEFPKHFTVGHRGSGNSHGHNEYQENTIESYLHASKVGCEFVECDIQLSKEKVPVIHHDFFISYPEAKEEYGEPLTNFGLSFLDRDPSYKYPINRFTVDQFRKGELHLKWHQKLPTFQDLLTELPSEIQLDIEVKYPYQSFFQNIPYSERNEIVDLTLNELAKITDNRKLFFSTFDISVLTMILLKQSKYTAFLIAQMEQGESLTDFSNRIVGLIPLMKFLGAKGFVLNADHMLKASDIISKIQENDLLICTWAQPSNNRKGILKQLDLGINGIITDNLPVANKALSDFKHDIRE